MFARTTRIISFAALAFVLIITAGCGQQDPDTSKTTHKSYSPDIGVVLAEKVDSGEWELGGALVNTLKIFANEKSLEDVYGTSNIRIRGRSHIINVAMRYLDDGKNEAHKKEIRRLLKILSKEQEEIKKNAIPIEKLKTSLFSNPPLPAPNPTGFFIRSAKAAPGIEPYAKLEWALGGNTHKIYFPADWHPNPETMKTVYGVKEAINKSISTYKGLFASGATDSIDLTLKPDDDPGYYAGEKLGWHSCDINVYKQAFAKRLTFIKQTVAHEVFHCYQDWTMRAQSTAYGAEWWREGSAEYFSSVVYKCTNYEWTEYIEEFDAYSDVTPVTELPYANFVFFLYLSRSGMGDRGVISLLKSMPRGGGLNEQIQALGNYGQMQKTFHQFSRDYLDKKIKDHCSSTQGVLYAPHVSGKDQLNINKTETFSVKAKPFHLARRLLTFKEGNIFFTKTEQDSPKAKNAAREIETDDKTWRKLPNEVTSACGQEKYLFQVTNASGSIEENKTDIIVQSNLSGTSPSTKPDKCLIGTWELINPSHDQMVLAVLKKFDKNATHSTSGKLRLKFNKRCKTTAIHKNFRNTDRFVIDLIDLRVRTRGNSNVNGSGTATYVARDGLLQYTNIQDGTCTQLDMVSNVDGMTIRFSEKECGGKIVSKSGPQILGMPKNMPVMPPGMPGFDGGGFPMPGGGMPDMDSMKPDTPELERKFAAQERYECSKKTLRLKPVIPGVALPFEEYKRISKKKK